MAMDIAPEEAVRPVAYLPDLRPQAGDVRRFLGVNEGRRRHFRLPSWLPSWGFAWRGCRLKQGGGYFTL